jgi:pyruvate formate lyase activating enzyme
MKEAHLYKKLQDKKVQCLNCTHKCVISSGKRGICGVRENQNGTFYSLVYGKAIAIHVDPIEKKPFFHFLPGSYSLSVATVGCPFSCWSCQNWTISQGPKISGKIEGEDVSPEEIVKMAKKHKVPSISYTYTDPIVFSEYALDAMKLAKEKGLKNAWVTNGFWSEELFELISPYLDAVNVDLKGFTEEFYIKYCGGRLQPVLETLKRLKKKGIWVEITTLVIPTLNDSEESFRNIATFIKNDLGAETPWHISRFSGAISWKLQDIPETPVETLKKAHKIGKETGLKYVHIGNVPGLNTE